MILDNRGYNVYDVNKKNERGMILDNRSYNVYDVNKKNERG